MVDVDDGSLQADSQYKSSNCIKDSSSHQQCFGQLFNEREIIACRIVLTYLTCTTGTSLQQSGVKPLTLSEFV